MDSEDDVREEVAEGPHDCHASLPESDVHEVVYARGEGVAEERGEEDEGDDCVT